MRAHGVPELSAYLRGETTLEEAARRACLATGQYTRRQATWFHNRPMLPPEQMRTISSRVTSMEQLQGRWMADMQNFLLSLAVDAPQHTP